MKTVKIYDNYTSTLIHECTGYTTTEASNISKSQALSLVENLYKNSKNMGNYTDKIIKLDQGYAELKIDLLDGRSLNRVIYILEN